MSKKSKPNNQLLTEELEPRLLLSAGVEALLVGDVVTDSLLPSANDASIHLLSAEQMQSYSISSGTSEQRQEIVFIDSGVSNFEQISEDIKNDSSERIIDVVVIDSQEDGIQQISDILAEYQEIDAIHFVTHGTAGTVQLGETTLNNNTLTQYADEIETWGQALSEDADLLFYGCDIAEDDNGKLFISELSELTGADIAASTDLTGQQGKGGDWELEYNKGDIETANALSNSTQQRFSAVLSLSLADETVSIDENSANGTTVTTVTATGTDQYLQSIYWVDNDQNKIVKADLDGTNQTDVLTGLSNPRAIIIDADGGKIYWSNDQGSGSSEIKRSDMDGSNIETIVGGLDQVDTLELDVANSKIYWTDSDANNIGRTDMAAGSTAEIIFDSSDDDITEPEGISFDFINRRMYFHDDGESSFGYFDIATDNTISNFTESQTGVSLASDITADSNNYVYTSNSSGIIRGTLAGNSFTTIESTSTDGFHTLDHGTQVLYYTYDNGSSTSLRSYDIGSDTVTTIATISGGSSVDVKEIDLGDPEAVVYSITGGNTNSAFAINSSTGEITVNDINELDYETTTSYTLTITATQNADSTTATITVNINDVNEAPTAANNTVTTNEDTDYIFTAADFNFADVDAGDTLASVEITSLETAGSLELSGVAVTLNQVITVADINAGNLKFVPVANANGAGYDSFNFTVNDGTTDSASAYAMTIDVTAVNDAPTAAINTVTTNEDTDYVFTAADFNFADVDAGDTLASLEITTLETVGSLELSGVAVTLNQVITVADINAGNLTFVPVANAVGVGYDSFGFSVNDGSLDSVASYTMTLDVNAANDAPTAANNTVTTNEDTAYTFTAADFNFADVDAGDTLASVEITSLETVGSLELSGVAVTLNQVITVADINAGNLTFVPAADANGAGYDSFGFSVNDGTSDSAASYTMTVNVTAANDTPTDITPDNFSVSENIDTSAQQLLGTITTIDVDSGETFTYTISGGPDASKFLLGGSENDELFLAEGVNVDYETQESFEITIQVTDSNGSTLEKNVIIDVNDVVEPEPIPDIFPVQTQAFVEDNIVENSGSNIQDNTVANVTPQVEQTDEENLDNISSLNSDEENNESDNSQLDSEKPGDVASDDSNNVENSVSQSQDDPSNTNSDFSNPLSVESFQVNGENNVDLSDIELFSVSLGADFGAVKEFLLSSLASQSNSDNIDGTDVSMSSQLDNGFTISESVNNALAILREQLNESLDSNAESSVVIGTVKSSSVVLAAGVGTWVLRGSTVLASVMSSLPMWNAFDPLPILSDSGGLDGSSNDDVDNLFEKPTAK